MSRRHALVLAVLVALCAATTESLSAHTFSEVTLTCPVDGTKVKARVTMSMTTFGAYRDFEKRGAVGSLYPDRHVACPSCHFAGTVEDFKKKPDAEVSRRVLAELKPAAGGKAPDHFAECMLAARIYGWEARKTEEIANVYLVASYLLRDDAARQAERKQAQLEAAALYATALERKEIEQKARGTVSYLVGELHRRAGRFDEALAWYARALAEPDGPEWLKEVVAEQRALAEQKNDDNAI